MTRCRRSPSAIRTPHDVYRRAIHRTDVTGARNGGRGPSVVAAVCLSGGRSLGDLDRIAARGFQRRERLVERRDRYDAQVARSVLRLREFLLAFRLGVLTRARGHDEHLRARGLGAPRLLTDAAD